MKVVIKSFYKNRKKTTNDTKMNKKTINYEQKMNEKLLILDKSMKIIQKSQKNACFNGKTVIY